MQEFTAYLKHRMRGVWRDAESVDPNTHNNKLATYHSWFATPLFLERSRWRYCGTIVVIRFLSRSFLFNSELIELIVAG